MLDALPLALVTLVSRFLMPGDANCLARSFNNVQIDWLKVLFNYARVEALHMEWCMVVDGIDRAKAFYTNGKTHSVTVNRAVKMFGAIQLHSLSNMREAILDCPVLFRVHKFTLDDSFFLYTAQFHQGTDTMITAGVVWAGHTGPMKNEMEDGSKLSCHKAISMIEYLDFQTDCDQAFKVLVSDMFATYRQYMTALD